MRGDSQLLWSPNRLLGHPCSMKTPLLLLLTNDPVLEDTIAQGLSKIGGLSHLTHSASDALQTVCGIGRDLDLAVIDLEHAPHGMSLLTAMTMCCERLPIIAVTRDEEKHVEALAYANGASACLCKPVSTAQIVHEMKRCCQRHDQEALLI